MTTSLVKTEMNGNGLSRNMNTHHVSVNDIVERARLVDDVVTKVFKKGEHYGMPFKGGDNVLLKPGAEMMQFVFQIATQFEVQINSLGGDHREYLVQCKATHIISGNYLGDGYGSCSTKEVKYRYRGEDVELTDIPVPREYWDLRSTNPPEAKKALKGHVAKKNEDGQWVLAKVISKAENPDIAEVYNTCLKMALKRAHIDTILRVTGASHKFTQDVDEFPEYDGRNTDGDSDDQPAPAQNRGNKRTSNKAPAPQPAQPIQPQPSQQEIEDLREQTMFYAEVMSPDYRSDFIKKVHAMDYNLLKLANKKALHYKECVEELDRHKKANLIDDDHYYTLIETMEGFTKLSQFSEMLQSFIDKRKKHEFEFKPAISK